MGAAPASSPLSGRGGAARLERLCQQLANDRRPGRIRVVRESVDLVEMCPRDARPHLDAGCRAAARAAEVPTGRLDLIGVVPERVVMADGMKMAVTLEASDHLAGGRLVVTPK